MSLGVEPGAEKFPAWALALESLGWLIRALGVIPAMAGIVVAFQHVQTEAFLMVLPSSIATASAAVCIGGIPISVAESARRRTTPRRWRLWAKILLWAGAIFCISLPLGIYGALYAGLEATGVGQGYAQAPISPFNPELLQGFLLVGRLSLLVGLALAIPALIWGRRSPPADILAVFN